MPRRLTFVANNRSEPMKTTYLRLLPLLMLVFSLAACGNEPAADEETEAQTEMDFDPRTTAPPLDQDEVELPPLATSGVNEQPSLPDACSYIDEKVLLEVLGLPAETPVTRTRGTNIFQCYQQVGANGVTADFVLEVYDPVSKVQKSNEIKASTAGQGIKVEGVPGRLLNDGRILEVATTQPFAVKLAVNNLEKGDEQYDRAERRELLVTLAKRVMLDPRIK
ncbi:MAG: hypothetical protein WBA17_06515 [Saprospiraceae bacterium]